MLLFNYSQLAAITVALSMVNIFFFFKETAATSNLRVDTILQCSGSQQKAVPPAQDIQPCLETFFSCHSWGWGSWWHLAGRGHGYC